ncbi:unnamed protein product [Closterium sp. Naga37s-1]|nr:unnamed protein product [Closterium sp. Naga37s-1]
MDAREGGRGTRGGRGRGRARGKRGGESDAGDGSTVAPKARSRKYDLDFLVRESLEAKELKAKWAAAAAARKAEEEEKKRGEAGGGGEEGEVEGGGEGGEKGRKRKLEGRYGGNEEERETVEDGGRGRGRGRGSVRGRGKGRDAAASATAGTTIGGRRRGRSAAVRGAILGGDGDGADDTVTGGGGSEGEKGEDEEVKEKWGRTGRRRGRSGGEGEEEKVGEGKEMGGEEEEAEKVEGRRAEEEKREEMSEEEEEEEGMEWLGGFGGTRMEGRGHKEEEKGEPWKVEAGEGDEGDSEGDEEHRALHAALKEVQTAVDSCQQVRRQGGVVWCGGDLVEAHGMPRLSVTASLPRLSLVEAHGLPLRDHLIALHHASSTAAAASAAGAAAAAGGEKEGEEGEGRGGEGGELLPAVPSSSASSAATVLVCVNPRVFTGHVNPRYLRRFQEQSDLALLPPKKFSPLLASGLLPTLLRAKSVQQLKRVTEGKRGDGEEEGRGKKGTKGEGAEAAKGGKKDERGELSACSRVSGALLRRVFAEMVVSRSDQVDTAACSLLCDFALAPSPSASEAGAGAQAQAATAAAATEGAGSAADAQQTELQQVLPFLFSPTTGLSPPSLPIIGSSHTPFPSASSSLHLPFTPPPSSHSASLLPPLVPVWLPGYADVAAALLAVGFSPSLLWRDQVAMEYSAHTPNPHSPPSAAAAAAAAAARAVDSTAPPSPPTSLKPLLTTRPSACIQAVASSQPPTETAQEPARPVTSIQEVVSTRLRKTDLLLKTIAALCISQSVLPTRKEECFETSQNPTNHPSLLPQPHLALLFLHVLHLLADHSHLLPLHTAALRTLTAIATCSSSQEDSPGFLTGDRFAHRLLWAMAADPISLQTTPPSPDVVSHVAPSTNHTPPPGKHWWLAALPLVLALPAASPACSRFRLRCAALMLHLMEKGEVPSPAVIPTPPPIQLSADQIISSFISNPANKPTSPGCDLPLLLHKLYLLDVCLGQSQPATSVHAMRDWLTWLQAAATKLSTTDTRTGAGQVRHWAFFLRTKHRVLASQL